MTSSFVAACSPTLAFKARIDAVDFSIFLAWNRKPFDEAGNLDSNNRVALNGNVWVIAAEEGRKITRPASPNKFNMLVVPPKVRINVCPIADARNLLAVDGSPPAIRIRPMAKQFTRGGLRRDDR
jgi:hypothetical protein